MAEFEKTRGPVGGVIADPVQLIVDKLRGYPHVTYELSDDGIYIHPPTPNGFPVWLVDDDPDWTVHAGDCGAHWHLQDAEEALELLVFCLSEDCRLKVEDSTFWRHFTLEARTSSGWVTEWQTAVFMIRLWKPKTVQIFDNKLISTEA
ncbi:hypothetical protein [Methylobacterium sp. R2-1]|uniref:hypothetical protein n=1 Tax=Methylobacterium sp. R2-1 TaxID=2587064 RepID=UPI001AED57BF|nr:hypothetical protein [Methylobacterium sp. R2-1]